jgi:hypothetical protein
LPATLVLASVPNLGVCTALCTDAVLAKDIVVTEAILE